MGKINHYKYSLLDPTHIPKLESKCVKIPTTGCLIWTGAVSKGGYGNWAARINGKKYYFVPHRALYILKKGHTELELDHLCRNPLCCNPD